MTDLDKMVDFFVEATSLKRTMRYNSCPENVQEPVAGHSWLVTLMVPILAERFNLDINVQHAMEIANVHDLAESIRDYDFDSYNLARGVESQKEKDQEEENFMRNVQNRFDFGDRIYSLWKEYEDGKTPEARFVRALDKLESHIHILERGGTGSDVDDADHQAFYADKVVRNFPELEPFLSAVKKRIRPLMESQGLVWEDKYNYPD